VWWWFAGIILIAAIALNFADLLRIARLPVLAGMIAPRNAITAITVFGGILGAALMAIRRVRFIVVPIVVALLVSAGISAAIVMARGLVNAEPAIARPDQLRIFSWNTNGALVTPDAIASAAAAVHANVVVLPDISSGDERRILDAFTAHQIPMQPRSVPASGAKVLVLISSSLDRSDAVSVGTGMKSRSLVVRPNDSTLPTFVAIHAEKPLLSGSASWDADLTWVADICRSDNVIAIGDFNATLDGFGGDRLGSCRDAATSVDAGSVGTWPTSVPVWLAMPIDHVLVTPQWMVDSFTVLTDHDASGARHRPILAVVSRR
jgi:endonuclease/exonuclease/phosphatase (EEP) superfamily protein YafD